MRELKEETHYRVEVFEDGDWQYVGCTGCLWNANKKARYYRNQHDVMTRVVRVSVVYKSEVSERVVARIHTTDHRGDDHARACDLRVLLNAVRDILEREGGELVSMDAKDMPEVGKKE